MDSLKRLGKYILAHKGILILGLICTAIAQSINLYNANLANSIIKSAQKGSLDSLNFYARLVILIFIIKGIFSYGQSYFISDVAQRISLTLRNQIYEHLQTLSLSFFDSRKTGQLMSAITNDVPVIQQVMTTGIIEGVGAPLMIIGGTVRIFMINWQLAAVTMICLPLVAYFISQTGRRMRRASDLIQVKLADISMVIEESLSAIRVIRSFATEQFEIHRFKTESTKNYLANMKSVKIRAILAPVIEVIGAVGITIVIWVGGKQIVEGHLTLPALVEFVLLVNFIGTSAKQLGNINYGLQQIRAGADRIFTLMDTKSDVNESPDALEIEKVKGLIEFDHVQFGYDPKRLILKDVSFTVKPGEVLAVVGPSGAGKSTIANLIPRFYDVTEGQIRIDGYDVKNVKLTELRKQIGIVPQETILFSGSLHENILYGRQDASEEEMLEASKAANAHTFIEQLPQKYETLVGERGSKLSGGQRQRVSIARALLKDPPILILDEATSSLDAESEALVQDALDRLMQNRTTIVIAHRLSTIRNADRILVIDDGRIVESGTHTELMSQNGLYAKLYDSQFGSTDSNN